MNRASGGISVLDLEPASSDFLAEVMAGLTSYPRTLPYKFFYDERGAQLFQKICELPEYYITRAELEILRQRGAAIGSHLGDRIQLIGLGTGAGTKTRLLLEKLREPVAYIPVDISKEQLSQSTALFNRLFPRLEIFPVCADYLQPFEMPAPLQKTARKVVYFPGSTIGNFEPADASDFLQRIREMSGEGGGLLVGADLKKDREILERAYNDEQGVTAQFNLNLLRRANRELGADFDLDYWKHRALYNADAGRIEMNLMSERDQTVHVANREFRFAAGQKIITEFSCKYSRHEFIALAATAGFEFREIWTDDRQLFGVFYFTVPG